MMLLSTIVFCLTVPLGCTEDRTKVIERQEPRKINTHSDLGPEVLLSEVLSVWQGDPLSASDATAGASFREFAFSAPRPSLWDMADDSGAAEVRLVALLSKGRMVGSYRAELSKSGEWILQEATTDSSGVVAYQGAIDKLNRSFAPATPSIRIIHRPDYWSLVIGRAEGTQRGAFCNYLRPGIDRGDGRSAPLELPEGEVLDSNEVVKWVKRLTERGQAVVARRRFFRSKDTPVVLALSSS